MYIDCLGVHIAPLARVAILSLYGLIHVTLFKVSQHSVVYRNKGFVGLANSWIEHRVFWLFFLFISAEM